MPQIICAECGEPFPSTQTFHPRRFCGEACQRVFKNRRSMRGGLIYDFLMTQRYDRQREGEARRMVQNLCRAFRDADVAERSGRKSWRSYDEAIKLIPLAFSTDGDKR